MTAVSPKLGARQGLDDKAPTTPSADAKFVALVVFLFFAWGFATVLIDTLMPRLKGLFALTYAQAMLTQFSFFIGYFLFSLPSAWILARLGYIRSCVLGLGIMALGCLLFVPAAWLVAFPAFLIALFVMAAGITLLQVTANPFITLLGPQETSSSRLTLAQAFNSLGTTLGPWLGAVTILRGGVGPSAHGPQAAGQLLLPFAIITLFLAVLALLFWFARNRPTPMMVPEAATMIGMKRLLGHRRLVLGVIAIFTYVGAEVTIGSIMVSYLMQPSVLGVSAMRAGQLVSLYWGGAMIGRFVGAYVLSLTKPGYVLAGTAAAAAALVIISISSTGLVAGIGLIAVGLCNSIMFPTIFAQGTEGLGSQTPDGSGLLCMAIVGGALVPPTFGLVADHFGIGRGLLITVLCYGWVLLYGLYAASHRAGLALSPTAKACRDIHPSLH